MRKTPFLITIDAEGDDLWSRPREITTRNAAYLPRFQALAERYSFKPVYLTNYEMALCDAFVEFGRDVTARERGEIGMHLHAWNSPPLFALTHDDLEFQPYLIEYPDDVMRQKICVLTALLEDRFAQPLVSHRAGRWGIDRRYVAMLGDAGYRVDCSVTPGINWGIHLGSPTGTGGPDYRSFPLDAYYVDSSDVAKPAGGGMLEVPMTIRPSRLYRAVPQAYRIPLVRSVANRVTRALAWLCPGESSLDDMLRAADAARKEGAAYLEFALHSSELMPGGSPGFRSADDIERLYDDLEALFDHLAGFCRGSTLREFAAEFAADAP